MKKIVMLILMLICVSSFVSANVNFSQVLKVSHSMGPNGPDYYGVGPQQVNICSVGQSSSWNGTEFICITSGGGFSNGSDITVRDLNITRNGWLNGSRICTPGNAFCGNTTINNITNNITNNIYISSATGAGSAGQVARWVNSTHLNASSIMSDNGETVAISKTATRPKLELLTNTFSNNAEMLRIAQQNGNDLSDVNIMFARGSTYNASIALTGNAQFFFQFKVMNTTSHLIDVLTVNRNGLSIGSYGVSPDGTSLIAAKNNVLKQTNLLKLTDSAGNLAFQVNDSQTIQVGSSAKLGFGVTEPISNSTLEIRGGSAGVTRTLLRLSSASVNDRSDPQMMFGRLTQDIATIGLKGDTMGGVALADLTFKVMNTTGSLNEQFIVGRRGVVVGNLGTAAVTDTKFYVENDNIVTANVFKLVNSTGASVLTVPDSGTITLLSGQRLLLGSGYASSEPFVVSKGMAADTFRAMRLENSGLNDLSNVVLTFARANTHNATIETLGNSGMDLLIKTQNSSGSLNEIIMFKRDQTVGIGNFGVGTGPQGLLHVKNSIYNKTTPFIVTGAADATLLSVDNDGDLYVARNVSATGYITRTDVYKSETTALDSIKPSVEYVKVGGAIDHQAFGYSYVNYSREIFDTKTNTTKTINEEGVDLVKEVALLKQALYEAKIRIEALESVK